MGRKKKREALALVHFFMQGFASLGQRNPGGKIGRLVALFSSSQKVGFLLLKSYNFFFFKKCFGIPESHK